jgi:hypothetical protein
MLKPQQLRVGNWIAQKEEQSPIPVLVKELGTSTINRKPSAQFEALKLTPKYLLLAGFEYNGAVYVYRIGGISICFDLERNEYVTIDDPNGGQIQLMPSFCYLHEVQNIIYELTSTEITISSL